MSAQNSTDPQDEVNSLLADVLKFKEVRNRRPLSCLPCRQRKLKCDRELPCGNCTKRQQIDTCIYAAASVKSGPSNRDAVKMRVRKLEEKIRDLQQELRAHGLSQSDERPSGLQRQEATCIQSQQVHKSPTPLNWEAILGDIADIRGYLEDNKIGFEDDLQSFGPIDSNQKYSRHSPPPRSQCDISAVNLHLPPRPHMDKLIAYYFEMAYLRRPVLHPKQFQREYDQFWRAPSKVSRAWLGLLFAVLRIAAQLYYQKDDVVVSREAADEEILRYRKNALENLDFQPGDKGGMHVIQGMIIHIEAESLRSLDSDASIYVSFGKVVRLTLLSGLHRDPSSMKDISPFMAEMRRRLWMCVVHLDILISAQVGMPTMVPLSNANTQPPRNLRNEDLDEETTELPASRPLDHITNLSLPLAKNALVSVCGRIALYLQDEHVPSNIVTQLDHDLKAAWEAVPDYFRVRPLGQSLTDPSHVIMWRYAVEQVYWTSLLLLHRKHVFTSSDIAGHGPETKGPDPHERDCIDAAIKLLQYQAELHQETQPSGRLYHLKHPARFSTKNDYFLAAVFICLELNSRAVSLKATGSKSDYRELEMLAALENTYHVWQEIGRESSEALKASNILLVMLKKLRPIYEVEMDLTLLLQSSYVEGAGIIDYTLNHDSTTGSSSSQFPFDDVFFTEPEAVSWDALDRWLLPEPPLLNSWTPNIDAQSTDWFLPTDTE